MRAKGQGRPDSDSEDHDLGGLDEGRGFVPRLQAQFASSVSGNNGGDALAPDGKGDLGHQAVDFHFKDAPDQLIATADAAETGTPFRHFMISCGAVQEPVDLSYGNPVMATHRTYRANLVLVDPLFQRGVADAEHLRGFAGREKLFGRGHIRRHVRHADEWEIGIDERACKERRGFRESGDSPAAASEPATYPDARKKEAVLAAVSIFPQGGVSYCYTV